jgi:alpha,alpha-trehalase
VYEVEHYHHSLPANRSYALTRSQPPFLAAMIRAVWEATPPGERERHWLERGLDAALLEYKNAWARPSHQVSSLCRGTGEERVCLARHPGEGSGAPPEALPGHFDWLWQGLGRSLEPSYRAGQLKERDLGAELELAFRNERCMRESGNADTYRWFWPTQAAPGEALPVNRCTDMVSVDLNSLLYKYEVDLAWLGARLAELDGAGSGATPPGALEARLWCARAKQRFALMKQYLWSARDGLFYDAFVAPTGPVMTGYVSATTLYPLWATTDACEGSSAAQSPLSTQERSALVTNALAQLEAPGGLLAGSRASRDRFSPRPDRGWDYPSGWAPHQMLAWRALEAHGFHEDAQRLIFSWLYLLLTQVIDYDGNTLEAYDVVQRTRTSSDAVPERGDLAASGFAWTNASFQVGLSLLDAPERARLAQSVARR